MLDFRYYSLTQGVVMSIEVRRNRRSQEIRANVIDEESVPTPMKGGCIVPESVTVLYRMDVLDQYSKRTGKGWYLAQLDVLDQYSKRTGKGWYLAQLDVMGVLFRDGICYGHVSMPVTPGVAWLEKFVQDNMPSCEVR